MAPPRPPHFTFSITPPLLDPRAGTSSLLAHSPSINRERGSDSRSAPTGETTPAANRLMREPTYARGVRQLDGVRIAKSLDAATAPPAVLALVDAVLHIPRDDDYDANDTAELQRWADIIVAAEDRGEAAVTHALVGTATDLLPPADYRAPFLQRVGRRRPEAWIPQIGPRAPAVLFGLHAAAFTVGQRANIITAQVIHRVYWPFLAVEVEAAGGGGIPAATARCAEGAAAAAVRAGRALAWKVAVMGDLCLESPHAAVAFSCAIDGRTAELFVHYCCAEEDGGRRDGGGGGEVYHMANVGRYLLADVEHLARLRRHLRNVADWGISEHRVGVTGLLDMRMMSAVSVT